MIEDCTELVAGKAPYEKDIKVGSKTAPALLPRNPIMRMESVLRKSIRKKK